MKRIQGMLIYWFLLFAASGCEKGFRSLNSDPVHIPDLALLLDLITLGVDTNGDSIISVSEAKAVKSLDITNYYGYYVTDATGLEAFVNLTSLTFRCNKVNELDLSHNTKLKHVIAYDNNFQTIDVSNCSRLEELDVGSEGFCMKNQLRSLDVSQNKRLKILKCGNNQLSGLDVTQNPELEILECQLNQMEDLDLSNNPSLVEFSVWSNQLSSLDLSSCRALKSLNFRGNQLSELDLSNNKSLEEIDGCRNLLSSIHLCCNTLLRRIQLSEMPSLQEVCVWTLPFPPESVYIDVDAEQRVRFVMSCN